MGRGRTSFEREEKTVNRQYRVLGVIQLRKVLVVWERRRDRLDRPVVRLRQLYSTPTTRYGVTPYDVPFLHTRVSVLWMEDELVTLQCLETQ